MTTGATSLLGLALPVDGELSGTWGDVVNYGITEYTNIAIAGTLSFAGDGAITLANTTGTASATNIGATTAQYAVIRITGTLTTTKIITAPSYSKTYIVDNAATGGSVTFKASGQTGVSIVVGEKCTVYYNGTDYVKVATSATTVGTVTSVGGTGTVNGVSLSGTVTSSGNLTLGGTLSGISLTSQVAGTLPVGNGGTGTTTLTANNVLLGNGASALQTVAPSTAGNVLTSNGTSWVSSAAVTGLPSQSGHGGQFLTTDGSNASWASAGAAAGGGIFVNNDVISTNYTIASGQNGFSVGPMTISSGYAITVSSGQRWVII